MVVVARSAVPRVGVYARISSDPEGDQLGVRRQIQDCERLTEERGWIVADRYVDDDISAWSGKRRPEYERLLADLRSGRIDGLVVWHLDRLTRHPRDLEAFIDLCEGARIEALGCVTGDVDLGTPVGRLTARMLGGLARYESDHKSERILRKHEELASAGKPSGGGSRPFGYEADKVTIRESEAVVVREIARRFLAGESIKSVSADLNERGITGANGGRWEPNAVRRLLNSPRIGGMREHKGEVVAEAVWPGIISKADSTKIRAILADPERNTHRHGRRYLLRRLLRCGQCGEYLHSRPRNDGKRRYVCAKGPGFAGCGHCYINADEVETWTVEACFRRLDTPGLADALAEVNADDPEAERWQEEVDEAQEQLDELAAMWAAKEITRGEYITARGPIEERRTAARKQIAEASRVTVLDGWVGNSAELRDAWETLDMTRQHAIISAVLDHVVVGPARRGYNRFDWSRLEPRWRL
jgi:DNA invertase Pin-like site-specific DNA recombinase